MARAAAVGPSEEPRDGVFVSRETGTLRTSRREYGSMHACTTLSSTDVDVSFVKPRQIDGHGVTEGGPT